MTQLIGSKMAFLYPGSLKELNDSLRGQGQVYRIRGDENTSLFIGNYDAPVVNNVLGGTGYNLTLCLDMARRDIANFGVEGLINCNIIPHTSPLDLFITGTIVEIDTTTERSRLTSLLRKITGR
jgi:hypothetical protein